MAKPEHGKKWMPAMYVAYYGILNEIAKKHGYMLCVHGSVVRDFDVVFVPFDEKISSHKEVLDDIEMMVGIKGDDRFFEGEWNLYGYEPHGRSCYCIECGGGGYFDISFTPTLKDVHELYEALEKKKKEVQDVLDSSRVD